MPAAGCQEPIRGVHGVVAATVRQERGRQVKAFVMKEIGRVGFMEKPDPQPGPGDAVVQTTRALICTSDSHTVQGGIGPRENLTLGHEAVGIVHAVGDEVKDFRPGDRVLVGAITPDWGDLASQNGYPSQSGAPLGGFKFANSKDGVFADYFHVNEADANLAKIPDAISDEMAVYCADMLSTGFMGAEKGNIPIGGTVAVLAQGPVGLMATAGARLRGAGLVIGVESVPDRQKLARMYGAGEIVDFTSEDVVERILDLTRGEGVDTAIEALGADVTFQTAVKITKPGGTVSVIGYFGEGEFVRIPRVEWGVGMADKTIATGLCPGGRLRMERLLRVLEAQLVDPSHMTTHEFRFDDMERAFEVSDKKLDDVVKVMITF
ncbi:putative NADP-dependent isopropanol dehydrogenase [Streptomyces spinoverrucosus]|uniref:Putative NADP-dependent isopropanol dehydrogenase n=1 Tax=Streptomyces spinoverrucosus TaxID=284043 RepID=A0A4Y3V604_9ACTN|nr:putative NADP-dependent isopropanol dehydrogenase [Streptomyces spinoverrucosus]GHB43168.1 putative NADP-dependent isopropanol dehydrogenase [Streptomyces spinoverrucosus]